MCNSKTGDPRDEVTIVRPKFHETVFKRLAVGAHCYAPIGLPKAYDIVAYNPGTQNHEIYDSANKLPETPNAAVTRHQQQEEIVWSNVWRGRGIPAMPESGRVAAKAVASRPRMTSPSSLKGGTSGGAPGTFSRRAR